MEKYKIKYTRLTLFFIGDQKHYCSDLGNNFLNGMNIYYKNYSGRMACTAGFGLYNLMPTDKITFFSTTIYSH